MHIVWKSNKSPAKNSRVAKEKQTNKQTKYSDLKYRKLNGGCHRGEVGGGRGKKDKGDQEYVDHDEH